MQQKWWMAAFKQIFRLFLGSLFLLLVVYLVQIFVLGFSKSNQNGTNSNGAKRNRLQLSELVIVSLL
jgi:hypothetical protein